MAKGAIPAAVQDVIALIGPLIAAVRRVFELSYTEATLTSFAWFIAYGIASIPAAAIVGRLGYSRSIIAALVTMVVGCLIVPLATMSDWYPGVLVAESTSILGGTRSG